ncbi:esterase/lipase family protein [Calidifontibacter indicus]|uniref:esterase/lipase family protein n=1 Tax=Calidifontibacter indicus TaxID=419650 RepID=UPI003D74F410
MAGRTSRVDPVKAFDASVVSRAAQAPGRWWLAAEVPRVALGWQLMASATPLLPTTARGDGHPVLVLPGLGAGDLSTLALRNFLRLRGWRPYGWHLGRNVGPTAAVRAELPATIQRIARRNRAKVSIIGWSLGGIYARELAHLHPDCVRRVITLASPYRLQHHRQTHAGGMFAHFAHLHAPKEEEIPTVTGRSAYPVPVPATSIYSREDGIVAWQHCLEPATGLSENIRVRSGHLSIGFDPYVFHAVADRLALPEDVLKPYRPPLHLRPFFPRPDTLLGGEHVA